MLCIYVEHTGARIRASCFAALSQLCKLQPAARGVCRVAAMKGCTTEWSKWEGITLDTKRYKLYTALSEVRSCPCCIPW